MRTAKTSVFYRLLIVLGMLLCLQSADAAPLKSLDDPLPVISGVMINKANLKTGTDFHASLSETIEYPLGVLPEGTQFIGHVEDLQRCSITDRLCNFDIWIDQVVLPDGTCYTIYPYEQRKPHFRYKAKFWAGQPDAYIVAGNPLALHFNSASLKGMLRHAQKRLGAMEKGSG